MMSSGRGAWVRIVGVNGIDKLRGMGGAGKSEQNVGLLIVAGHGGDASVGVEVDDGGVGRKDDVVIDCVGFAHVANV